jgi:hypothetical protein
MSNESLRPKRIPYADGNADSTHANMALGSCVNFVIARRSPA